MRRLLSPLPFFFLFFTGIACKQSLIESQLDAEVQTGSPPSSSKRPNYYEGNEGIMFYEEDDNVYALDSKLLLGRIVDGSPVSLDDILEKNRLSPIDPKSNRYFAVVSGTKDNFCQGVKEVIEGITTELSRDEKMSPEKLQLIWDDKDNRLGVFPISFLQDEELSPTLRMDWQRQTENAQELRTLEFFVAIAELSDASTALQIYTNLPDRILKRPNGLKKDLFLSIYKTCYE